MSIFRENESPKRRHLLVFDTSALLSANEKDRVQVWRNNEQLGECYVPGATYAEIVQLAGNPRKPKEQEKARNFLQFASRGCRYRIQPTEDNQIIPIDNQKDRQIIACAYRLSSENPDAVIVLVTYELALQGLVKQSGLPNFCTLTAANLATWFHQDYRSNKVPQEVFNAYKRMQQAQQRGVQPLPGASPATNTSNRLNSASQTQGRIGPNANSNRRGAGTGTAQSSNQVPGSSQRPRPPLPPGQTPPQPRQRGSSHAKNVFANPVVLSTLAALAIALGVFIFTKRDSNSPGSTNSTVPGIVSDSIKSNPEPLRNTPPALIAEAETAVIEFQRTKDPSVLKRPLNLLQELRNKQGRKLDESGEQSLSRLKHKYAIEVLATSGQLAEAASLLRQIPQDYSDINSVREWLTKQNR